MYEDSSFGFIGDIRKSVELVSGVFYFYPSALPWKGWVVKNFKELQLK